MERGPVVLQHIVHVVAPHLDGAQRDLVANTMQRDEPVGIMCGTRDACAYMGVITPDSDRDVAVARTLRLVRKAAAEIGPSPADVTDLRVDEVQAHWFDHTGKPRPGGRLPADAMRIALPDGRTVRAARAGPLEPWMAALDDEGESVIQGRWLSAVLRDLLALPFGQQAPWVHEVLRQLQGRTTPAGTRYPCPCCDCWTLVAPPTATYAICKVCCWEDDDLQFRDPEYPGGANRVSLLEARANYTRCGAADSRRDDLPTRPPLDFESP